MEPCSPAPTLKASCKTPRMPMFPDRSSRLCKRRDLILVGAPRFPFRNELGKSGKCRAFFFPFIFSAYLLAVFVIIDKDLTSMISRITSLRLIQPRIEVQNALQAALQFEERAFREANQKVRFLYALPCSCWRLANNQWTNSSLINRMTMKRNVRTSSMQSRKRDYGSKLYTTKAD